ncbi:hypothetical protein AMTR_s00056p00025580 [Amborella trichopoda]|uniref:PGG domain-containing protein n=1 Tax=Amborella trichopoda TaxID=13333 RepID=U5CYP3_AMBTC|nr:hypothetical protein AMTR_s00056p00025580 [Amborella trichopoda]
MELLSNETQNSCFQRDRDGQNPVHCMAMRACCFVLWSCRNAAKSLTDRGENFLHLCLKYGHQEMTVNLIREFDFVREVGQHSDNHGSSVLSLARATLTMR